MSSETPNINDVNDARRAAIADTIQPISVDQVKTLGEGLFPYLDHPWRHTFFTFIDENLDADFYYATTHDRVHILYCHSKNRGIWFLPGSGLGPLQEAGLRIMKEIVETKR